MTITNYLGIYVQNTYLKGMVHFLTDKVEGMKYPC
jgi:hypothetical protein